MKDIDVLIANYQSIIRVLASQVRSLEAQSDKACCVLLPEECAALADFIKDKLVIYEFHRDHGNEGVSYLLSAWVKIRKGGCMG